MTVDENAPPISEAQGSDHAEVNDTGALPLESAQFFEDRKAAVVEEFQAPDTSSPGTEAAEVATPAAPATETKTAELPSRAARRLLAKESELRKQRDQFRAEKAAWEAEKAEAGNNALSYKRDARQAIADPKGHLKALGLNDTQIEAFSKHFYMEQAAALGSDEYTAQLALHDITVQQEQLRQDQEAFVEEAKQKAQASAQQSAVNEYVSVLQAAATEISIEEFPLTHRYANSSAENMADTVQAMYNAAEKNAASNPTGTPLTPEDAFHMLEEGLRGMQDVPQPPVEKPPAPTQKASPNTLRNQSTSAQPSDPRPLVNPGYPDRDYLKKVTETARAAFQAKLTELGVTRD